jgi:hypothetical protein
MDPINRKRILVAQLKYNRQEEKNIPVNLKELLTEQKNNLYLGIP